VVKFQILFLVIFGSASCAQAFSLFSEDLEPAVGSGNSSLYMQVNSGAENINYNPTNNGYYFLSLSSERLSVRATMPVRDKQEVVDLKGDSKITDYQFAIALSRSWQLELFYQRYQSYFIEYQDRNMILPDLSMAHTGGQITYVLNPAYSSSMLQNTFWRQEKSDGSWFLSGGYDRFNINGDLVPTRLGTKLKPKLQEARVDALGIRAGYGYNWIWSHWFAGAALSYGATANQMQYSYGETEDSKLDTRSNVGVGAAMGYRWLKTRVGIFTRVYSWTLKIDDKELSSSTNMTGFYVSSFF
jgi:hypothetical protein